MTTSSPDARRERFRALHRSGTFVLPNPWDVGSARVLEQHGFGALATTSSGLAASLGLADQGVTRDELVAHVGALCDAVDLPVNVDAERCYADDADGIGVTVDLLAAAGAAGISIEDYDPARRVVEPLAAAVARVRAAAAACERHGIVLTARAENHLYGVDDLDDTIARLRAYRDAGAEVLYAPGPTDLGAIGRLARETGAPLNVLARHPGPSVPELAAVGVRRVSTGGSLAWAAYGGLAAAARELLDTGTSSYLDRAIQPELRDRAFRPR